MRHFCSADEGSIPHQNVRNGLLDYMTLHPRRLMFIVTAMRTSNLASVETGLLADF
jgi:hypothetical protein